MVIKGRSRSNGAQLAGYLLKNAENDRAQVLDIRGTAQPDSLKKSLLEMSFSSELTKRGNKGMYHAQVNPAIGEDRPMTPEDWLRAADLLEQSLGFDGQKRAIVLHEKNGRVHGHIVWERYDHETGKLRTDSQNFKKHDQARALIEQELGHERTPQKVNREPTHQTLLSELWQQHLEGESFVQAAAQAGYYIAQGNDRRPFRVVTPDGQSLNLVKQLDTANTKEVRDKLQPIRADLLTEADALQRAKAERDKTAEPTPAAPALSTPGHDLAESQDLALAMLNRQKEPAQKPKLTYSFTVSQSLNLFSDMLYSDVLARQQAELLKLNQDHYTTIQRIKEMDAAHYQPGQYANDLARYEAAHARQVQEVQARFEQEKKDHLNEPAIETPPPIEDQQPAQAADISINQDTAAAMLAKYRQRQADRQEQQRKAKEMQQQAADQNKPLEPEKSVTDEAAAILERYQKRQRERGREGPEL